MDLHAHLTTGYSAGFLAGEWDKATQRKIGAIWRIMELM